MIVPTAIIIIAVLTAFTTYKNNNRNKRYKNYNVQFVLNGFKCFTDGKNIEIMKNGSIANYFPVFSYDDLLLVSSVTGK